MKFKKGDKVRVKRNSKADGGKWAGKVGAVLQVCGGTYPYWIEFEDMASAAFCAVELEKED